jgi:uncharacterized membrane protein
MRVPVATRKALPAVAALVAVPLLFHIVIVETSQVSLASGLSLGALCKFSFVTISALTHWAIYTGLLLTFALTLRPGREALITGMARRLHGPLAPELATYTRRVTIAWCCFFAAQLMTSVTLFFFAPLRTWSFFVNILDIPLVVAMFAAEYLVRLRCLQNPPRHSLSAILGMIADIRKPREEAAGSI